LAVNFWKSIKSSIYRRHPSPSGTIKIAEELGINQDKAMSMSKSASLQKARSAVQELRVIQREVSQKRQEWIERKAQNIAKAAEIPDWKKHMEDMLRMKKEREVNRKLTAITKGPRQF
jgi:hypothetical protein